MDEDDFPLAFLRTAHEDSENEKPSDVDRSDQEETTDESESESDNSDGENEDNYDNMR